METFRLFVSSPGDAIRERQRVERVATRLNTEFANTARLEAVRWETRFYQAFATFQKQIAPSTDCDIVVAIFRARLGVELPADFATMPDGEPYPSGTAYEILTAIDKRQKGAGLPDIYVFRYPDPPSVRLDDDAEEQRTREQWSRLKGFFARWFVTPQGHFKAAFQTFSSTDDFESQLERLLREWLAQKVAKGRILAWPITTRGTPFPGLQSFGFKHAPVFFGRTRDIMRAVDQLRDASTRGHPFLLVVGASGAGKSSLVRAGIVPRLASPGVIPEIDGWRVAAMRPSDSADGVFTALANALLQGEVGLPPEDEGRPGALPEIAEGPYSKPAELAALLAHADATAVKPIMDALARIGEALRVREGFDRPARVDLALVIDQLDEIFSASVSPEQRSRFGTLLSELAKTGRVWIVATLRADLYELLLREPTLFALKEAGVMIDLAPPGMTELAEIVRKPAEAAGLVYEANAQTHDSVDVRLLHDADKPDMLPLVQLALSRLCDARQVVGDKTLLTFKAYDDLGGMSGIIEKVGEEALARLSEAEVARLPQLLRLVAEPAEESRRGGATLLTVRSVPLAEATRDEALRGLVGALVEARLMTTSGAQLRLAHQRVLSDWTRARTIVRESAEFYRIRDEAEAQRQKWDLSGRRAELLLARGLPLSEAESIVAKYGDELTDDMRSYVAASRRRANRGFMLMAVAAGLFAIVAGVAGLAAKLAVDEGARAESNFAAAKRAVDGLILNVAQGLQDVTGMRVETVRAVLDTVRATIDDLVKTAPGDVGLQASQVIMLNNFVDTYLKAGDLQRASTAGNEGVAIARRLVARDQANAQSQRMLSVSLYKLGDTRLRANDPPGALALYEESLAIVRTLTAKDRTDPLLQRVLWVSTVKVGDARFQSKDAAGALTWYQDAIVVARRRVERDGTNIEAQRDLSISHSKIGEAQLATGDEVAALASYQESLVIRRRLAAQAPDNAQAQRDVALDLNKIGDAKLQANDRPGAIEAYEESLRIFRALAASDRGNARAQRDVAVSLNNIGDVKLQGDDKAGALAIFEESLEILRALLILDKDNVQAQIDVVVALTRVASVSADPAPLYREALRILEALNAASKLTPEQRGWIMFIKEQLGLPP